MRNAIHILKTLIHSSCQLPQAGAMGGSTASMFRWMLCANNMSVLGMQWSVIWIGIDLTLTQKAGLDISDSLSPDPFSSTLCCSELTTSYQQQAAELTYKRRSKQQRDSSLVEGYFRKILCWQMFLLDYKLWSKWTNIRQQCFLSLHFS